MQHYKDTYFTRSYNGFSYDIREGAEKLIYEKISDVCVSMKAEDYLTLPGRISNIVEINFSKALRKKYDDFERDNVMDLLDKKEQAVYDLELALLEADDEEAEQIEEQLLFAEHNNQITAANAAALSIKLLQFANGAVYDNEEEREWHKIHDLKLDALEEIVESAQGKPVLVAWAFQHGRDRILKKFKKLKPRQLKNDKDVRDWNAGKIRMLLMHPASGGHGLNLQEGGNIIVWYGLNWSLEYYEQFNARLDRQGQKEVTLIYHLVVSGTMDGRVMEALEGKRDTQASLMKAIKATVRRYERR